MARPTQHERLDSAEYALQTLEDELGMAFGSLRSAGAITAYFATRRGYDPEGTPGSIDKECVAVARRCCGLSGDPDRQMELAREGASPAQQLVRTARDFADRYKALTQEIELAGGTLSEYGTWENAARALLMHSDLRPYVERFRARFPGTSDKAVAHSLFHFERRGGEFWAVGHDVLAENAERL